MFLLSSEYSWVPVSMECMTVGTNKGNLSLAPGIILKQKTEGERRQWKKEAIMKIYWEICENKQKIPSGKWQEGGWTSCNNVVYLNPWYFSGRLASKFIFIMFYYDSSDARRCQQVAFWGMVYPGRARGSEKCPSLPVLLEPWMTLKNLFLLCKRTGEPDKCVMY